MGSVSSRLRLPLFLAAAGLIAGAALTSVAVPAALRGVPASAVIATVDLEQVISQLSEKSAAEASLKAYSESLQGELDRLNGEIKNQESKISALDGQAKKDAVVKLIELKANGKVKAEVFSALVDQRRGEVFKTLYEKISETAQRLAKQSGYTMVIVSDERVRVPAGPSQDIERTISLKRFLYVDKGHDITGDLITLMNSEYKAGPATPAAGAGGNR
ncbi:MAG: OmpH family outer membrane protein [Phycisphaerales bacterium]